MYGRRLVKEELMKSGITLVTEDGHVFRGDIEVLPFRNKQGYLMHNIYELDENGNKIRVPNEKSVFGYNYKQRSVGLHRLMWAWFHDEVPSGMVVDHISNKHFNFEDYNLSNLNCTTPGENIMKERTYSTRELACRLDKPRSFYEDKLAQITQAYEQSKKDKDAVKTHKIRTQMSQYRAKLRYYDSHIKDFDDSRSKRAATIKRLQANIDSARKYYKEALAAYGKDDSYVMKLHGEWKMAIAELYAFKEECQIAKEV